jgi:outer membrane protein assembly factor BamC
MHKLGEIRWLYVEALPSSVWPLMKDFWASSNFGLSYEDPNSGIFESQELQVNSKQTKLQMKIEHGIRQASSEIFLSHLIKNTDNNWIRVPVEDNLEDDVLRDALDFLSDAPSTGGTSLVALNLNLGQKAALKQSEDGSNFIEMNLEFPRAWAAVDRALKEALITVNDLDRTNGVFFVSFTQEEEEGFVKRLFKRNKNSKNPEFKIYVKKIGQNKCTITVDSASEAGQNFERDLLSEINQSLS